MKRLSHQAKFRTFVSLPLVSWVSFILLLYVTRGCLGEKSETAKPHERTDLNSPPKDVANRKKSNGNWVKGDAPAIECVNSDKECEKDKLGLEAIKGLHLLIDDDHNGNVDQSESDEFLRDELQYTDGFERQALFHNNDKLISVDDLWKAWKHSTVYNWTVDDVIEWLVEDVDLPQYAQLFHNNEIDGAVLPRLVNSTSQLLSILGIRNPVHKQKLSLKAMDAVLFGAPKRIHSYAKDLLLITSLIIAIGGCWFACLHHRYSQTQVKKMMKDLESLQKAEESLKKLSKELQDAETKQMSVSHDKQEELRILRQNSVRLKVPHRPNGEKTPSSPLSREGSVIRRQEGERKLREAEEELAALREALTEAENKLEIQQQLESQWSVPGELQAWLQLTHELEQLHYNAKRQAAERQLLAARDGCDKIKRRNKAFFGSLRMAHSNSMDDVDQSILDARAALEEVKQDLTERLHRWHTIEILCGFPIISNPGLSALKQALGRDAGGNVNSRLPGNLIAPVSIEEADEDLPPAALLSAIHNGNTGYARPRALSADDTSDTNSIYNQIPERQRQQIFAWARRSRLNYWMKKKKTSNGFLTGALPSSGKSSTFLNKQAGMGSTGSLAHTGKVQSSCQIGAPLVRKGSRENELAGPQNSSVTGVMGSTQSGVSFHLGENANHHGHTNPQHERSYSNASLSLVSPSQVNGQGHHGSSRTVYSHSQSYPPYSRNHSSTSSAAVSPGLSMTGSSGNLGASNTIPRIGNSTQKFFSSASGHHLATQAATPVSNSSFSTNNNHGGDGKLMSDLRDTVNNNVISNYVSDQTSENNPSSVSQVQEFHNHSHLEDSDAISMDSIPRSHSRDLLRGRLDRSPELDLNSLDTDSQGGGSTQGSLQMAPGQKKPSKKKKFLPAFLHKKGKQKTN